jgi:hypothetical protein
MAAAFLAAEDPDCSKELTLSVMLPVKVARGKQWCTIKHTDSEWTIDCAFLFISSFSNGDGWDNLVASN